MTVEPAQDRNTYRVTSRTRRGMKHTVDLESMECSCEGALDFSITTPREPCAHIEAAIYYAANQEKAAHA